MDHKKLLMSHTQTSALKHIHREIEDLLTDYAGARLNAAFFIGQMNRLSNQLGEFVKENGIDDSLYERDIQIHKSFYRLKNGAI